MAIEGFENITYELTEKEKALVPSFVNSIKTKIGKQNIFTSTYVINKYKASGKSMSGARFRKIINYIRINGLIENLISTSKGYYIATTQEEKLKYIKSLDQRINQITVVRDQMEYQRKKS